MYDANLLTSELNINKGICMIISWALNFCKKLA